MNLWQTGLIKQIVKSPINPILLICIIIVPPLFILAALTESPKSITFFCVAIGLIVVFVIAYLHLLFKNPEYLRSEKYQFQMNQMRYGDKDNFNIETGKIDLLVKNPNNFLPKEKDDESK